MSWLHKKIFWWGANRRNPSLYKQFLELKKTEKLSREELLKMQEERLKTFVQFAYKNSSFYKDHFEKTNFNPIENWSLEKFKKTRPVSKADLINFNQEIHTPVSKNEKTFFVETSGTSGEILTFHRDELWDSFNRAAIWRGTSWYGVNPWDFSLYFWGYNSDFLKKTKLRFLDFLVNRFRVFDYNPKTMASIGSKLNRVKAIEGYSSMIYELAQINENNNLDFSSLKMVKGTSEKIMPHYQDVAQRVFGQRIISEYGATECSIIAFECPKGNMHITTEGLYTETDPETGGILVTNMVSRSFPIIRYQLGDKVKFKDSNFRCTCGLEHPVIEEVTGRIGSKIYGLDRSYPSLTLYYIFKNIYFNKGIKIDFQAHQFEKGKLQIWIKDKLSPELNKLILTEASNYFMDLELELIENHNFRENQGKLRDFISHIPS